MAYIFNIKTFKSKVNKKDYEFSEDWAALADKHEVKLVSNDTGITDNGFFVRKSWCDEVEETEQATKIKDDNLDSLTYIFRKELWEKKYPNKFQLGWAEECDGKIVDFSNEKYDGYGKVYSDQSISGYFRIEKDCCELVSKNEINSSNNEILDIISSFENDLLADIASKFGLLRNEINKKENE